MLFYAIFTIIYGLMNWLVLAQAVAILGLNGWTRILVSMGFAVMVLAPMATGLAGERTGVWAAITYLWLGLTFYLFLGAILLLPIRFLLGRQVAGPVFIVLVVTSVAACVWGVVHARTPQVREQIFDLSRLAPAHNELRIALISDVHLHSVEAASRLDRILTVLAPLKYDLLISAGDLVEAGIHLGDWPGLAARLAEIKPRLGKFAILGNHELYANATAGGNISAKFLTAAGFDLLVNEIREPGGIIQIVGVAEPTTGGFSAGVDETPLLARLKPDLPVLVLKHRPAVSPGAVGRFDLMLSGHTHDGQMWPFGYVVRSFFPYFNGRYELGRGSRLYVSSGTGTWGPPIRIGTTPEVTLIRLVSRAERS